MTLGPYRTHSLRFIPETWFTLFQSQGIGRSLVLNLEKELKDLYMIDLLCDEELISYYEKLGMRKTTGMMLRNYENQNGKSE